MSHAMESDCGSEGATVKLPATISITETARLRDDLLEIMKVDGGIAIDASQVQRIDTAGLQLLAAFVENANTCKRSLAWWGETAALTEAAERLGLADLMQLSGPSGA